MASLETGRHRRFHPHPWEIVWRGRPFDFAQGRLSPAYYLHRRLSQGMPEGRGGRKLYIIIDAGEGRTDYSGERSEAADYFFPKNHGCVSRLFSVAA